jgi:hypothetical protein
MAGGAGDILAFIGDVVWTPPADTVAREGMRTVDSSPGNR